MKTRVWLACLLVAFATTPASAQCQAPSLRPGALALLKPLMILRNQQAREQFTDDGRWIAESKVTPVVESRTESILANRTKDGDQALAYLLTVYMGEHQGESIVCEAINRGKRMTPTIQAFQRCQPAVGAEPLHKFVAGSGHLPGMALRGIAAGERCRHEQ